MTVSGYNMELTTADKIVHTDFYNCKNFIFVLFFGYNLFMLKSSGRNNLVVISNK